MHIAPSPEGVVSSAIVHPLVTAKASLLRDEVVDACVDVDQEDKPQH